MNHLEGSDYKNTIMMLDASNLCGVVHSFSDVMSKMVQDGMDNPTRDSHPITILYVSKIMEMTGSGFMDQGKFGAAYEFVKELAKEW